MPVAGWLLGLGLALAPGSAHPAEDVLDEARGLRRAGKPQEAIALLDAALGRDPDADQLEGLLALCLMDAGDRERAAALAERHAEYAGDDFRLCTFLGRFHRAGGDGERAVAAFRRATRLNDKAVEAWVGLIELSMLSGRLGKALNHAQSLEQANPELGRYHVAHVLRAQGDQYRRGEQTIEFAADKYVEALGRRPEDPALATLAVDTLLAALRVEQARALVADHYDAGTADRHYWLARAHLVEQDAAAARTELERALALDADHGPSALWMARLHLDVGALDAARTWLERARATGLRTGQSELLMGEVLDGLGDLPAAETHLRAAIGLDPNLAKAHYLLGRVLLQAGRKQEATEVLEHFREMQKPPPVDVEDA